jgi:23S rRNA (cytidine1920-2'-O)/16S rRNA (cytidine1409-2'-O)-methyltransferase
LKERLDVVLTEKGFFTSREKAKAAIMAGLAYVDGNRVDKPGTPVNSEAEFSIKEDLCPYVSRGGLKLEKALKEFALHLDGAVCMDIGASTGGFTDCMLQNGASVVYTVDVGYGQLDWKLRNDSRVVNMEKTNIRLLDPDSIETRFDFISIDVSFISLKLVFPIAAELLKETGRLVCLVKPQFEAGKGEVGKKGIIKDKSIHKKVIVNVIEYGKSNGIYLQALAFSPITGAKGNIEYLMLFRKSCGDPAGITEDTIDLVVNHSHLEL